MRKPIARNRVDCKECALIKKYAIVRNADCKGINRSQEKAQIARKYTDTTDVRGISAPDALFLSAGGFGVTVFSSAGGFGDLPSGERFLLAHVFRRRAVFPLSPTFFVSVFFGGIRFFAYDFSFGV